MRRLPTTLLTMARKASEKESVVKVRTYGALMGALLTISTVEAAEAATCDCVAKPPQHKAATLRHAPAHIVKHNPDAGAEYARSYYDYRSSSHVGEVFFRPAPVARDDGWRVAPNDAHIRFYHDERVVYGPGVYPQPPEPAYPQSYYPQPDYPPQAYYPSPASDIQLSNQDVGNGGVGYGGPPGGGGGGGPAFLYMGQSGGSDVPPNGGGVNLPGGYGPTYRGVWQGPVVPTQGGGAGVGK
jgi:hypothetical protein